MDPRAAQKPLKDRYREDPDAARIVLTPRGGQGDAPVTCSGDLLGALAAERIEMTVEGDLDLRGTPGVDRFASLRFTAIRVAVMRTLLQPPEPTTTFHARS